MADEPTTPEPSAAPDWSAFTDAGITPDKASEVVQAYQAVQSLNNLDTRPQALQNLVRPDLDGQILRQMLGGEQEAEQPADPWQQFAPESPDPIGYDAAGNPVFAQPPGQYAEPGFDPRSLQPVFDQYGNQVEERAYRRVMDDLQKMAVDQSVRDSSASAAQQAGLPASVSGLIEQHVREQMRLQPNRQAADLAADAARSLSAELMAWRAAPAENPPPTGAIPSGPAPSLDERPKDFKDAARIMAERLRQ